VIENASSENAGTYTVTVTDANGNTYVSSTDVVIFPAPSAASNSPACEGSIINLSADGGNSYSWAGPNGFTSTEQNPIIETSSLTNAGTYTATVTRSDGSTRTATVSVAINPSYNVTASPVVSCDDYTLAWNQTVTSSGEYSHRYASVHGCDSVVTVNVTINSSYNLEGAAVTACDNHTLPWGTNVTASGDYSHTYTSLNGCDSVVSIHVAINATYHITEPAVNACDSHTLPWGEVVTATGDYSHTYSSITTCDSTINVHVNVHSSYNVTGAAVSACDSHTLPWGDVVTSEGNYRHTYSSVSGCDSTVTIYVDVHNSYNVVGVPVKDCDSHTMPWGTVVTTSGDYTHTYTTAGGCDSTVAIHVTINHRYNLTGNAVTSCTSYTLPWGEVATTTDNYDYTYTAVGGCDSTVTIHVTINPVYNTTTASVSACNSYALPWGVTANASGDYSHLYTSVNGCDSTVSLHVTINNSASSSWNATACDSYNLPWGGSVTSSGNYAHTYSTVNGCDSVVTAHVTINHSYNVNSASATACNSYTLPWGATVAASGNYSHHYNAIAGCDSLVTIHVTINSSAASSFNATACGSYSLPWGGSVTSSGNYSHTYSTVNGCDSVVTANITINGYPVVAASGNTACAGATLNLTASGGTTYSWSGPNSFTSSLQNPSINGATTSMSGTYTVTVTNASGCSAVATASATVNALPVATASANSICAGGTLNFTSGGGSSYSWSGPNGFTSSIQNPTRTNATSIMSGTYTVTVTNASGCSATATANATVNALPSATASSNSVCVGGTLNLISSGGSTYSWSGPNSFTSALQNPSRTNATSLMSGTYTVTVTNASGCSANTTVAASVNANASPSITGNNTICSGSNTTFDAGSGYSSYLWSTGATTQTISVSTATTYTVTVTNFSGCSGTASGRCRRSTPGTAAPRCWQSS
jgi:NADH:ubiquinone oxidoreductase subunit B-like Fe-S oxidoreductase